MPSRLSTNMLFKNGILVHEHEPQSHVLGQKELQELLEDIRKRQIAIVRLSDKKVLVTLPDAQYSVVDTVLTSEQLIPILS